MKKPASRPVSKVCVLVSGGLDSGVLVADLLARGREVHPLYVRSGFVWEDTELAWLKRYLAAIAEPRLKALVISDAPMSSMLGRHWSLTGRAVPAKGAAYDSVYLPGRNLVLLSEAGLLCISRKIPAIAFAILRGNPFPDARPRFLRAMEKALSAGLDWGVTVEAPYLSTGKDELVRRFASLPLKLTFSCLKPQGDEHCGKCSKCEERERALALAAKTAAANAPAPAAADAAPANGTAGGLSFGALPDDPGVAKAIVHYNAGRFAKAVGALSQVEGGLRRSPGLLFLRAICLGSSGRTSDAARDLQAAVLASPPSAKLSLAAATKLREWGLPVQALPHLRAASKGEPSAVLPAAEILFASGRRGEAAAALRQALAQAPEPAGYIALAILEAGEGDGAAAAASCRKAAKLGQVDESEWRLLLSVLNAKKLHAAAYEAARLAADAHASSAELSLAAAKEALLMARFDEALSRCAAAERAPSPETRRDALSFKAGLLWSLGDHEEALTAALAAARGARVPAPIVAAAAEMLELAGRLEDSHAQWRRAQELDPDYQPAQLALGRFELRLGDYGAAADRAGRWLKGTPRSTAWLMIRAAARLGARLPERALADASLAVRLAPKDAEALALKGEALRALGRHEAARRVLGDALGLRPSLPAASVNRLLADLALGRPPLDVDVRAARLFWPRGGAEPARALPEPPTVKALRGMLDSWHGSRESNPVYLGRGGKMGRQHPVSGKERLMRLQARVCFETPQRVLQRLTAAGRAGAGADAAQAAAHRGEIQLWLGRLEAARREFATSLRLDPRLRWSRVGLAAVSLLGGDCAEAERWFEKALANGASPRVMRPWRAESLWRQGKRREAFEEFRGCVAQNETRLSSFVWLGLAAAALGETRELERAWERLRRLGYPLLVEAAGDADGGFESAAPWTLKRKRAVLERCVELMGGNRSSWLQTFARRDKTLGVVIITTPRWL